MTSGNKTSYLLKKTFGKAINSLSTNYQGASLTDIFITVNKENGDVTFFDDENNQLIDISIEEWAENDDLTDEEVADELRSITQDLNQKEAFSILNVYYPFSINYADENMSVVEELLTIDDDSIVFINDDLLAKFDREFDEFLDKLLKE